MLPTGKRVINVMLKYLEKIPLFLPANNGNHNISTQYLAEKQELVVDVSAEVSMDLGVIPELCNAYNDMSLPLALCFQENCLLGQGI